MKLGFYLGIVKGVIGDKPSCAALWLEIAVAGASTAPSGFLERVTVDSVVVRP